VEIACLTGITLWKRSRLRAFFPGKPPIRNRAQWAVDVAGRDGGAVGCWASRAPKGLHELAAAAAVPVFTIEDGFIRSRGLGAALNLPASILIDRTGIHYDPSRPSDLETLLQYHEFAAPMLARATRLIRTLRTHSITKYNLGGGSVALPADRRTVLVAGQVEDDRSMLLGGGDTRTMCELLRAARAIEPESFLIYKPHPDVVAGLRTGAIDSAALGNHADLIVTDVDLTALLERVDAVHVCTSLTGFEALLRGRQVVVHGQPFYAGWGLTRDLRPVARRTRQLMLSELVAGALIAYPRYVDPVTADPCEVEQVVARLMAEALSRPGRLADFAARARTLYARQFLEPQRRARRKGSAR
jgi:capsular polysaccharide export protein